MSAAMAGAARRRSRQERATMSAEVAVPSHRTRDRAESRQDADGSASALYEGRVRHRRHRRPAGSFTTAMAMAYLDLAEVPTVLDRHPLWSARRVAPVEFRAADHLDGSAGTPAALAERIRDLVGSRLGADRRPAGPVRLLTQPRTLGWAFNPLSVFFCFDGERRLQAVVCEVTNTPWHERCWYVVPAQERTGRADERVHGAAFAKAMHVSPFLGMDHTYRFSFTEPAECLWIRFEAMDPDGRRSFDADLVLRRVPITARSMLTVPGRHPAAPMRTSLGIYRRALALWWRGAPVHSHPRRACPADDLHRGHRVSGLPDAQEPS
jgi:DUF1365 family protein